VGEVVNNKKLLFIVNVDQFFISHRLPIALKAMEMGFEVHLLCTITDRAEYLESFGLIVHPFLFSRSGMNILGELLCVINLYKQVKYINPEIVHLVTIKAVLYGGIVARLIKVPGVVSAISGLGFLFVERKGLVPRMRLSMVCFLYRLAMGHPNQKVILQNPTDMKALISVGGLSKEKVKLIRGSGVNLQDYSMRPEVGGVPVVVMASRLLKDKGVFEFVEAARIIKGKGIEARFQLIGEPDLGNPESVSCEIVQTWNDTGVVECLGFRMDIAVLFAQAHIVTLPSYYGEGLPKVLIEAAACGRAVITTDMPGCRDAIESDISGILVPARDAKKLAGAIERLITDAALRQQMGRQGRILAEREFSIDKVVLAHLEIYNELDAKNSA